MPSDEELLNWLESNDGYALVSDDNGHWACVCGGIQNCPMDEGPEDVSSSFFIEKEQWKDSIRAAIVDAMERDD